MEKVAVHPLLKEIASIFTRHGKAVYLVGGAVRDILIGDRAASDWDLATDARPEEVMTMFRRVIPTGIKHGTVTVRYKGHSIETTTFRTESAYSDGRHPDGVEYAATIEEDLSRRDFTMNAAAVELPSGKLTDPFGGKGDIQKKLIRCVGDPAERFLEDGLRPLRAVRFAAQLGFEVESRTLAAILPALETSARVAPERVKDEIDKILFTQKPSRAFLLMEETGLLELIFPELTSCRGIDQKGFHRFDVLDHSLLACDFAARDRAEFPGGNPLQVRLAALFHDIGKPEARNMGKDGVWTFYQHERISSKKTRNILTRLRYPNTIIDTTCHLIEQHMFHYDDAWTDAALRRFIIRVGETHLSGLYALRRADAFATAGADIPPGFLLPLRERVNGELAKKQALSLKDLAVSGKDLIRAGIKPGKYMGIILNELLETVLDDPELNTREKLLEIAEKLNARYG